MTSSPSQEEIEFTILVETDTDSNGRCKYDYRMIMTATLYMKLLLNTEIDSC
jgi:hypothetical protein